MPTTGTAPRRKRPRKRKSFGPMDPLRVRKRKNCEDIHLNNLLETMLSMIPTTSAIKHMTSKGFTEHRKAMNRQWTILRKFLIECNKTHFNS